MTSEPATARCRTCSGSRSTSSRSIVSSSTNSTSTLEHARWPQMILQLTVRARMVTSVAEGIERPTQLRALQGARLRSRSGLPAVGSARGGRARRGASCGVTASALTVSRREPMRIGIVCPYSLTVPGGVQAQVLGLARELRRRGHEARVLGPCDGPPPEPFVTPLGDCAAAVGQRLDRAARPRPVSGPADHPGARRRAVRRHPPPRAAGARARRSTALMVHSAPTVGTFHAAGTSASYRILAPALQPADRAASTTRSSCRRTRWRSCSATSAASTRCCSTVSNSTRSGRPHRGRRADDAGATDRLLLRPPRGAQGPRVCSSTPCGSARPPTSTCGSAATARTPTS